MRIFNYSLVCTAVLLCASVPVVWADEAAPPHPLAAPAHPRSDAEWKALIAGNFKPLPKPLLNQPLTFNSPTISLVTTPSSKVDVATFLQTPVSFQVKDASFLSAFDAVLTAAGKACPIECRGIEPMKVTFGAKGDNVGVVLDTLSKMGGASLWLLPDKLLLCRADALSDADKEKAKPWSVLIPKDTRLPAGNGKLPGGQPDMMAILNKKITASVSGGGILDALTACYPSLQADNFQATFQAKFHANEERIAAGLSANLSVSFEDVTFGEALGTLAHLDGYELYLMPDHCCLFSSPGSLTPEEQKVAIPVFTYPGFGKSALPALSAPNS